MGDQADALTTTGRRVWGLTWRLALPWVVCGGLLWALVGLTPRWGQVLFGGDKVPTGLVADWMNVGDYPLHPRNLVLCWNYPGQRSAADNAVAVDAVHRSAPLPPPVVDLPTGGLLLRLGNGPAGFWMVANVGCWWLLPFPLLWSGFNLWRWVRRRK